MGREGERHPSAGKEKKSGLKEVRTLCKKKKIFYTLFYYYFRN